MAKQPTIDEYLQNFEHPLREAIDEVRQIVRAATSGVSEIVKWNAPTFVWGGEYLATIHVKALDRVMVIFHNDLTPRVTSDILEGDYADGRRMAFFGSLDEVREKRDDLTDVVRQLTALIAQR